MRRNLIILLLIGIISCSDGLSPENNSLDGNGPETKSLNKVETACANNEYPQIGTDDDWEIEVNWDPDSNIPVTRKEACVIWSHNVTTPLGTLPRGTYADDMDKNYPKKSSFESITKVNPFIYDLEWDFVWCDYYILEVKYFWFNPSFPPRWETKTQLFSYQNDEHQGDTSKRYTYPEGSPYQWIEFKIITSIEECNDAASSASRYYF